MTKEQELLDILVDTQRRTINLKESSEKILLLFKDNESLKFTAQEILDDMDSDMEDSGMSQGEIESNINHWRNKYLIVKRGIIKP